MKVPKNSSFQNKFLMAKNLPESVTRVELIISKVRQSSEKLFDWSDFTIQFDPVHECTSMALNRIMAEQIAEKLGDETDSWVGCKLTLDVVDLEKGGSGFELVSAISPETATSGRPGGRARRGKN